MVPWGDSINNILDPHTIMEVLVDNHTPFPLKSRVERMHKLKEIDKEDIRGENANIRKEEIEEESSRK